MGVEGKQEEVLLSLKMLHESRDPTDVLLIFLLHLLIVLVKTEEANPSLLSEV